MTTHIDTAIAAVSTVGSAVLGSQVAKSATSLIAEATPVVMPEWLQWAIGPAGALVGLILALRWMAGRLDKAEKKIDQRETERDEDRKRLIEVVSNNTTAFEGVKAQFQQVRESMERQATAVNNAIGKLKE